jgi:hypothetical protein
MLELGMDRPLLLAALRVLSGVTSAGPRPAAADVDLLKSNALPEERDIQLDDLARSIAHRTMGLLESQ